MSDGTIDRTPGSIDRTPGSISTLPKFCSSNSKSSGVCVSPRHSTPPIIASAKKTEIDPEAGDPGNGKWTSLTVAPPPNYVSASGVSLWTGSTALFWGGTVKQGLTDVAINTGGIFDPKTNQWTQIAAGPGAPSPRINAIRAWTGKKLLIFGGSSYTNNGLTQTGLSDGAEWDSVTGAWTAIPASPLNTDLHVNYSPSRTLWTGTELAIFVPPDMPLTHVPFGSLYNPENKQWRVIPDPPSRPPFAAMGTYIWTGSKIIVWGAKDYALGGGLPVDTDYGAMYDPAANSWTLMSKENAPKERSNYAAVWTGKKMLVWGGWSYTRSSGYQYFNDGGIFDPATNSWQKMSTAGAPTARLGSRGVWTGTKLLVWGGGLGEKVVPWDAGGIYDPDSDTWKRMSIEDSQPSPRGIQLVEWNGTKMIALGMEYGSSKFNLSEFDIDGKPGTRTLPTVAASKVNLAPGEYFKVSVNNVPDVTLGLYSPGTLWSEWVQEKRISDSTHKEFYFVAPEKEGIYEIRAYAMGGKSLHLPKSILQLVVTGKTVVCGTNTPSEMEPATLASGHGTSAICNGLCIASTWYGQKPLPQPAQIFANVGQLNRAGINVPSQVSLIGCSGNNSELDLKLPLDEFKWGRVPLSVKWEPQSIGPKSTTCSFSYCDGFHTQKVEISMTGSVVY